MPYPINDDQIDEAIGRINRLLRRCDAAFVESLSRELEAYASRRFKPKREVHWPRLVQTRGNEAG